MVQRNDLHNSTNDMPNDQKIIRNGIEESKSTINNNCISTAVEDTIHESIESDSETDENVKEKEVKELKEIIEKLQEVKINFNI